MSHSAVAESVIVVVLLLTVVGAGRISSVFWLRDNVGVCRCVGVVWL
ncbi:hypothetical protein HMPREF0298_0940 [Corynebacterium lipophiloflavum DSM 44291]|uniref:Uncharacterized protein n=1 Tax=Corynebacterium lipophiloflavum (strain ATCC 700352 / DSM 44291 / CCUG 37336 / JCM 10383 / DMMZ 1944) TaxID=525263 RepID=C0XR70_CORLD|nr:hypothetical protein HMPREF0298_0940 [Corynebacterium lipophiloflavum DSM 44291]